MTTVALTIGVLGLLVWGLALVRLRKRRFLSAGSHGFAGGVLLLVAAAVGALALNLQTYKRLTHEQPVAELAFDRVAPRRFCATLQYFDGERETFVITGDEWQLDARILKWNGLATLAGLDTQFRLERLSGRFRDLERARSGPYTVYPLYAKAGLDVWRLAQRHEHWLPWVDGTYGAATYLPMADRAAYGVQVTASGLIARPINKRALTAVAQWR
jgi:hypothetical protein